MTTQENWLSGKVIGISVSESEDLLGHGFGREHLREFLMRLAQRLLRAGANLAYGGHFKREGSFTRDLIDLISEEQREGTGDNAPWIGMLYNHSPWPHYLDITDDDEANFVDACRFIRITQAAAGIPPNARIDDPEPSAKEDLLYNKAIVASYMRRAMAYGMTLDEPRGRNETIPPIDCRVMVGGKTSGFSGILPGLYEELLYCFEKDMPVFILGAFGGASGKLVDYLNGKLKLKDACLDLEALKNATPDLARVEAGFDQFSWPKAARRPAEALQLLVEHLKAGKKDIAEKLGNRLNREENLRLFAAEDTTESAELILRGLRRCYQNETH